MAFKKSIFIIFIIIFLSFPFQSQGAVLHLSPQSQTLYQGDSFVLDLRIDTEGEEINAIGVSLLVPEKIEVIDFNKGSSVFSLWAQDPVEEGGTVSFAAGVPRGFLGEGSVLKLILGAGEEGRVGIELGEESRVLLNDGKGTEVQLAFLEGSYNIIEKPGGLVGVSVLTHPDSGKWYSNSSLHLRWDLKEGAEYSYLLSRDPLAQPDEVPDKPEGELLWLGDMKYEGLDDGIYYFHLKEKKDSVWSPVITKRVMIDTRPPEPFTPQIGQQESVFGGQFFLSFSSTDRMSGVDHYEVKEGSASEWKKAQSPYLLKDQGLGGKIRVKAVDKAGNERVESVSLPKKPSPPFPYGELVVIGIIFAVILWVWRRADKIVKRESKRKSL